MLGLLGIDDGWVAAVYLLCIASALLCVIYGALTWNKGQETVEPEDVEWAGHEREIEEEL